MAFQKFIFAIIAVLAFSTRASATGGSTFTYEGYLTNSDGTPVVDSSTQIKLQVRSPGTENCLMYEEVQTQNLSGSNGFFKVSLNDGTGTRTDSATYSIDQIFANYGIFNLSSACTSGASYTPSVNDGRVLQILVKTSSDSSWETFPSQVIGYVPMASQAKQVGGFSATNLLRVENTSGPQVASSFTPANFTDLLDLINGTSAKYVQSGSTTVATGSQTGYLSSTDWTSFSSKLSNTLASGNIFVGNGSNVATPVSVSGDIGMTATGVVTVGQLKGTPLSLTTLGSGQYLKYSGSAWINGSLTATDISAALGSFPMLVNQMPGSCAPNETLTFSSPTGTWNCSLIFVDGSAFSSQMSNLVFASPSGSSGNPQFRAITISDLPAGAYDGTYFKNGGNALGGSASIGTLDSFSLNIKANSTTMMTIMPSGNVGIGTTTPSARLDVQGQIVSREFDVATGASVDFSNGNTQVLSSPGSSSISLANMVAGGNYTVVITDTSPRTYTFNGASTCTNSYYQPSNGLTSSRSIYKILAVKNSSNIDCYITWVTGYM